MVDRSAGVRSVEQRALAGNSRRGLQPRDTSESVLNQERKMGDNLMPADADPLRDRLTEQYAPLRARVDELAGALERVPETIDEASIDKASAFVKQIKACSIEAETARKTEKEDFLEAGRKVDSFFGNLAEALKKVASEVERRMQAYLRAKMDEERRRREEEAKRAAEEAKRLAAEARKSKDQEDRDAARLAKEQAAEAARAAEAKAAELARTRGALGGTATLATSIDFEVTDRLTAVHALAEWFDDEAIAKAARSYARNQRSDVVRCLKAKTQPLHGLRFFEAFKTRVS